MTVMDYLVAILFCLAIVWSWVAWISEKIARRRSAKSAVPWPDEILWARFGRTLLDLGLFGGKQISRKVDKSWWDD